MVHVLPSSAPVLREEERGGGRGREREGERARLRCGMLTPDTQT